MDNFTFLTPIADCKNIFIMSFIIYWRPEAQTLNDLTGLQLKCSKAALQSWVMLTLKFVVFQNKRLQNAVTLHDDS